MSLHHSLACDSPGSRRLRRWAPLVLVMLLTALALAPGHIAGDRPFQTSLCEDLEQVPEACTPLERMVSAAMHIDATGLGQPE